MKKQILALALAVVAIGARAQTPGASAGNVSTGVQPGTIQQVATYPATGSQVAGDSTLTDSGTQLSYTGSGGIQSNGGFNSSGASGGGIWKCGQGTEPSPASGYVGQTCPATITTAYFFIYPGAPAGDTNNRPLIFAKDGTGNEVESFGTQSDTSGTEYQTASGTEVNGDFCVFNSTFDCIDSTFLASNIVRKDTTNTGAAGMTLDMSASTGASALKIPVQAGATAGADGVIDYDSTNKNTHVRTNGADSIACAFASAPVTGDLVSVTVASGNTLCSDSGVLASNATQNSSGVNNKLPKYTAAHTLGTSSISDGATAGLTTTSNILTGNNTQRLTADTSNITATTAGTGTVVFTWGALPVSTNFSFSCYGTYTQATATGGVSIAVQGATNAPTLLVAWASMDSTNPASTTYTGTKSVSSNITTTTATNVATVTPGAVSTQYQWELHGSIEVAASASTLNIIFYSGSGSDAVVVKAGSFCSIGS